MHPQVSCVDVCKPPHPQHILEAGIRDWHSRVGTRVPQSREPLILLPSAQSVPRATSVPGLGCPRPGSLGQRTSHTWSSVGPSGHTRGLVFAVWEATVPLETTTCCRSTGLPWLLPLRTWIWTQCPSGQVPQALTDTHGCDPARPGLA